MKEARDKDDLAKIEFVHRRINGEIRYEPDPTQWELADHMTHSGTGGNTSEGCGSPLIWRVPADEDWKPDSALVC